MACRILTRMVLHFCRVGRAGKGSRRPKMRRRSWQKWKNSRNIKRLSYNRIPQKCAKSSLNRVQFETRSTNLPRSPRGGEDLNWNLRVSNWTRFRTAGAEQGRKSQSIRRQGQRGVDPGQRPIGQGCAQVGDELALFVTRLGPRRQTGGTHGPGAG